MDIHIEVHVNPWNSMYIHIELHVSPCGIPCKSIPFWTFEALLVLLLRINATKTMRYCILNGSLSEWSVKRSVSGDDGAFAALEDGICHS